MKKMISSALWLTALMISASDGAVITGYDVKNAADAGFGGWQHVYTGTITPTGESGAVTNHPYSYPYTLSNYAGGTGTLADGTIGNNMYTDSQLFVTDENPEITLYLDNQYLISSVHLLIYPRTYNSIPGNITGLDVSIGGRSETFASVPLNGDYHNELIDLASSPLSATATSILKLSNITTTGVSDYNFALGEIVVIGEAIPEPASAGLIALVSGGICFVRRFFVAWHPSEK